jgi:3-oxoacyl-[acyl-carrier protein] reductase
MSGRPVSLVSGAASGIGRHMAKVMHRAGHRVTLIDLDTKGLERLVREQGWDADRDVVVETHVVRDARGWDALVDRAVGRFGHVDFMLNIAGYLRPGYVHEMDAEFLERHIDINAKGVMFATRAAARHMIQRRKGHILNVASIAGISHVPGLSAYCASKHAVRGFTLAVAHELSRHGVAVTAICPDAVETPMLTLQEEYPEAAMTFGAGRGLTLEEVEDAVVRAMKERPLEVVLDVPGSGRAAGARLANMFPKLATLAVNRIIEKGLSTQRLRTRGVDGSRGLGV